MPATDQSTTTDRSGSTAHASKTGTTAASLDVRDVFVGAVAGALGFLGGYAVTYLLTANTIRDSLAEQVVEFLTGEPGTWKLVGWVFFNAHGVSTTIPGLFGGSTAVNLIERAEAFSPALYVIPPTVLLAAGAVLAFRARADTLAMGARTGATVVAGYLPLGVVGAFAFVVSTGDAAAGPDLIPATFLAGVVSPLLFGAVGGGLVGAVRAR